MIIRTKDDFQHPGRQIQRLDGRVFLGNAFVSQTNKEHVLEQLSWENR
ncbi:MAG: hypothetical protein IKX59_08940 [Bacteroidales bacterium]|nr:hypothetical protein [Bacteroidales bacterium]